MSRSLAGTGHDIDRRDRPMSSRHYRPELDGIRAIAILSVLGFHVGFPDWSGGFIGVDVFFVLSGWLICGHIYDALRQGDFRPADFFARRIRRLLPAAFACYVAVTLAVAIVFLPFEQLDYLRYLFGSAFFFNNILLGQEAGYFAAAALSNPLLHTWSLSIEEQFYLVVPWLALAFSRVPRGFVVMLAVAFAVSLGLTLLSGEVLLSKEARYFSSLFRVWEIALGGLAYTLVRQRRLPRVPGLPLAALAAVLAPVFMLNEATLHPGPGALAVALGTLVLILFVRPETSIVGRVLAHRSLSFIGRISYSTYLWHWPLIVFWSYLGNDLSDVSRTVLILVSLGVGALSYRFVEAPVRRLKIPGQNRRLFAGFAGQAVLICAIAGGVWLQAQARDTGTRADLRAILDEGQFANPRWSECWYRPGEMSGCPIGTPGAAGRPLFVWGDSMANSAVPAFDRLAQDRGAAGLVHVRPGCAPLLNMARDGEEPAVCLAANRDALAWLQDAPASDVILFARWPLYALGYRNTDASKIGTHGFVGPDLIRLEGSNLALMQAGLAGVLQEIPKRHSVTIVGPPPEFPYPVPAEMVRAIRFGGEAPPLSRVEYLRKVGPTIDVLRRVAASAGVGFVDLSDSFCTPTACPPAQDGKPVLSDMVHLSRHGNDILFRALRDSLPTPRRDAH